MKQFSLEEGQKISLINVIGKEASPVDVSFFDKTLSIRHFRDNVNGKNLIYMIVTEINTAIKEVK